MTRRDPLPQRRRSETFDLPWGGLHKPHVVTVGFYEDNRPGEIFINAAKSGEAVEAMARDSAVIISMALQHGVPVEVIAKAITRDGQNNPLTVIGFIIDLINKERT